MDKTSLSVHILMGVSPSMFAGHLSSNGQSPRSKALPSHRQKTKMEEESLV